MRIAVDLRPLQSGHAKRGIGKYLKGMLPELFEQGKEHQFECYIWRGIDLGLDIKRYSNVQLIPVGVQPVYLFDKLLLQRRARHVPLRYMKRARADVFFQPDIFYDTMPGLPNVTVLYDIIPLLFEKKYFTFHLANGEDFFAWKMRDRYAAIIRRYAKTDRVLSISEASARDLHKFDPTSKAVPVTITPLAAQGLPAPAAKSPIAGPYFLYVGGNDHRKNLIELLADFESLIKKEPKSPVRLVLAGNDFSDEGRAVNPWFWDRLETSSVKDRVELLGYVDDKLLATLYEHCTAFLFASQYEGFGLPILEAMSANAPVIAYKNSSIPEVAGSAAILAETRVEFTRAMARVLKDPHTHAQLVRAGRKQAKAFTWKRTAQLTLQALLDSAQ